MRLLRQAPWGDLLRMYVRDRGHWPTEESFRRMTLPEAKAAVEAQIEDRRGAVFEAEPPEPGSFSFGKAIEGVEIPPELLEELPEPLLRRAPAGTVKPNA
jgi:hypothetical protein